MGKYVKCCTIQKKCNPGRDDVVRNEVGRDNVVGDEVG